MQKWEYLYAQIETGTFLQGPPKIRYLNGHELANWKESTVDEVLSGLGEQGWELSGSVAGGSGGWTLGLIFKRPKSEDVRPER